MDGYNYAYNWGPGYLGNNMFTNTGLGPGWWNVGYNPGFGGLNNTWGGGYYPYIFPWITTYTYTGDLYSDADITDFVSDNIDSDPYISSKSRDSINVDVTDGIVTLTGNVKNRTEKAHAYWDAYWTTGVIDVINDLNTQQQGQGHGQQQTSSQQRQPGQQRRSR